MSLSIAWKHPLLRLTQWSLNYFGGILWHPAGAGLQKSRQFEQKPDRHEGNSHSALET